MNKFKFYFIALASLAVLFSCNKSDDKEIIITPIPYADQYGYDMQVIQTYLKTHYIKEIVDNPGQLNDQDIVLEKIPANGTQESIWNSSLLDSVKVDMHDIEYTIYYIKQRIGVGESPSRVDDILAGYEVTYLRLESIDNVTVTPIESNPSPDRYIALNTYIKGWAEILPLFKSGTANEPVPGEPATFENFGAGVMFIPPGLAYYNVAVPGIPPYAQLMFKFKLYSVKDSDQDGDGILSDNEDLNGNGRFDDDDTDGDGIPNYLDADDDGDGRPTRREITQADGTTLYPFDKIPDCDGNQSNPDRVKRHLDYNCRRENEGVVQP